MEAQEQLRITWSRGAEFLAAYDRGANRYTVSVPHSSRVLRRTSVGGRLLVEHRFADTDHSFRHVARVVDHEPGPPEVVTFEFDDTEHAVRDLVVCHAEGQTVPYLHRRAERRAVWLPIEIVVDGRCRHGIVTELSELGAFVTTSHRVAKGSVQQLRLPLADGSRLELAARVVYARAIPEPGFAVELVFASRESERRIQGALGAALRTITPASRARTPAQVMKRV